MATGTPGCRGVPCRLTIPTMVDYTGQLDLEIEPFSEAGRADHFFPGGNRQAVLDQLLEFCSDSSDPVMVTGQSGAGKTTLAHSLELHLAEEFVPVLVQAALFMSPGQLLEEICATLNLGNAEAEDTAQLAGQLDSYVESLRARSRTLVLIIDDAHELGTEALEMALDLLRRHADSTELGEDGARVVLLGEASLSDSVQQLATSAQVTLDLEPLDPREMVDYIAFKLKAAGYRGKLPLGKNEIAAIHRRSNGLPGAVDVLADEMLRQRVNTGQLTAKLGVVERNLLPISGVFGVVVLVLFFTLGGEEGNSENAGGDLIAVGANAGQGRIEIPLVLPVNEDDSGVASASSGSTDVASPAPQSPRSGTGDAEDARSPTVDPVPVAANAAQSSAPQVDGAEQDSGVRRVSGEDADPVGSAGARALLARPPERYTLQLLGSHSEANVRRFIESRDGTDRDAIRYFESRYQDKPWFVVVYGDYVSREEARDALGELPADIQELQPWARNLADIQADIRRHR